MKRELKLGSICLVDAMHTDDCRAYPDEKGIETDLRVNVELKEIPDCRAYPDEKGIETSSQSSP